MDHVWHKTRLALLALLAPVALSCKDNGVTREDGDKDDIVAGRKKPGFFAADAEYLKKNSSFYFRVWNDTFTKRFEDLPDTGEVADGRKPYSGGYYAEGDGGTDQVMVGAKSPLQKYDDAFHAGENKASAWERKYHTTGPEWAGHCNGFAATAQRHPIEPSKDVVRGGVTFAAKDIKALLAEVHMNADYEFLGGNRCETDIGSLPTPDSRKDPTVMGECEDINPATMHAAITNWIGRMRHTLIMDIYTGEQVWNYPLYKYAVLQKDSITAQQAAQYVDNGTNYKFNPQAVKFAYVHTKLTYAEATRKEILGQLIPKEMDLTYVLEMNAAGELIGGEWAGAQSRKYHPDFIWVALEPIEPNGTRYMGNPNLDSREVIKLWAESVGADPENPPLDIKRPATTNDWGTFGTFDVVLDGNAHGAVFAGKPTQLHVTRKAGLTGAGVILDVGLNGSPLKTLTSIGDEEFKLAVDAGIGLNRLQLTFKKGGAVVEDQYLRFDVVR